MKNFFSIICKNLSTVLLSLVIALAIWVIATSRSDPTEVGRFYYGVETTLVGLDENLVLTDSLPENYVIYLRAPNSVWREINNLRPTAKAVIDVTGLKAGEYDVPVKINLNVSPIQITSFSPSSVTLNLEQYTEKTFPVDVREIGTISTAFKASTPVVEEQTVTISGPLSLVNQVNSVRVILNHANATESIETSLPVTALNEEGTVIRDIDISPETVTVKQEISLRGGYRVVAAKLVSTGNVENGLRVTDIRVNPEFVTIYSTDRALIDEMPSYLETETIDLSTITESLSKKLSLKLPQGVTIVGDQTISVNITVEPVEGTVTISNVPVSVLGLEEGFSATISPELIDVLLTGPVRALEKITSEQVLAAVELQDLTAGQYQLTPNVSITSDEDVVVQSLLPATIEVTIKNGNIGSTVPNTNGKEIQVTPNSSFAN